MKKEKLKLNQLKVKSFTTSVENTGNVLGGGKWTKGLGNCPHTGAPTLDPIGCNSLDQFYCHNQSIGVSECIGPSECCPQIETDP